MFPMKNTIYYTPILWAFLLFLTTPLFSQKFGLGDLIGTNIRREDPVKYLNAVGFVREYHDWVIDESDKYLPSTNGPNSPTYNANLFRWNPGYQGMSHEQFTPFYTNIINNLSEIQTQYKPICSNLKFCLPALSGTGGNQVYDASYIPQKPYLDIALEFKPVKTNRSGHATGQQDLYVNSNPATTSNLAYIDNPTIPGSYLWFTDWVTQFSKAFATDNTGNLTSFKTGDATTAGQNKVGYVEIWNEQDKNWYDWNFNKNGITLPNLIKFTPEEYAAMGGMAYDGFSQGVYIQGQKPNSPNYPLGLKNTVNGKAKSVFGGLFDIGNAQWTFVEEVNKACNGLAPYSNSFAKRSGYATNPSIKFPFDVLNFHHYCDNSVTGLGTTGVAPELDNVSEVWGTTKTFKKRLREIRSNTLSLFPNGQGGTNKELWLSEFGWDTNLESDQRAEQPGISQEEAQGRYIVRTYLEVAAARWDRAMQYSMRDEETKATGFGSTDAARYRSSGMIRDMRSNFAPKLSYWYVSTLRNTLANYYYVQELEGFNHTTNAFTFTDAWQYNTPQGTPRVYLFQKNPKAYENGEYPEISSANQDILAVWLPTANNSVVNNYRLYLKNFDGGDIVTSTRIQTLPGDEDGLRTAINVEYNPFRNKYFIVIPEITESPQYIILGNRNRDIDFPNCPTNVNTVAVGCDAIALNWENPSGGYEDLSVYYYAAAYGEPTPAFDLGNPNWKLYVDKLPVSIKDVTISGLSQVAGTYYVALIPRKRNLIPQIPCVHEVKTAACFGGIAANIIKDVNQGNAKVLELFNYDDVTFCNPQRNTFAGGWDDYSPILDINLVPNGSNDYYKLFSLNLFDQNGVDDIQIYGDEDFDNNNNNFIKIGSYTTNRYLEWATVPLNSQAKFKRLRLVRNSGQAVIQRMVLYGYKNADGYHEPTCCGSDAAILVGTQTDTKLNFSSDIFKDLVYNDLEIVIKGEFNFNTPNLTLENCTIYMDEDALPSLSSLNSNERKTLNLRGTTVQGCKKMWKGFSIFPNGDLYLTPSAWNKPSIIRDAEKALIIERSDNRNHTFLKSDETIFERNMFGVFIDKNPCDVCNTDDFDKNSIIKATIFDGSDSELKPPGDLINIDTYKPKSITGIYTSGVSYLSVGLPYNNFNSFTNLDFGIQAKNTNLTVENCKFSNILERISNSNTGIGIEAAEESKIEQTGFGGNFYNNPSFENVTNGIIGESSFLFLKENNMSKVANTGIVLNHAIDGPGGFNHLENNTIVTNNLGISMNYNDVKLKATNNQIYNFKDKNVFGIYGSSTSNTSPKVYDLQGNYVQIKSDPTSPNTFGAGILLNNTFSPNIQSNTIQVNNWTLTPPLPADFYPNGFYPYIYGILENNNQSATFCSNIVNGVYNNQGWGLKSESSTGNKYDCNAFNNIGKGMTFMGNCVTNVGLVANNIVDNDFGYHTHALYLQANGTNTAQIGKQLHTGNDWTNLGYGNWAAFYQNATPQDQLNNTFQINNWDNALGHTDPFAWFSQSQATDMTCQNPCQDNQVYRETNETSNYADNSASNRGPDLIFGDGFYKDVITGQDNLENFSGAYQWMIRRNIYREIVKAYNSEFPEEYKNFMVTQNSTSVGVFQDFEVNLGRLGQNNPDLVQSLLNIETDIANESDIAKHENEQFNALTQDEQVNFLATQSPTNTLSELWNKRYVFLQELKNAKKAEAQFLLDRNNELPVEKDFERYEQQINALYLNMVIADKYKLSTDDSTKVDFIASVCPFEGGFAVYKARNLYTLIYNRYKPEWFECKEEIQPRNIDAKEDSENNALQFTLYPNPSKGDFYIHVNSEDKNSYNFRLLDATGQVIFEKKSITSHEKINTQQLTSGLYLVEITDVLGNRAFRKIIIQGKN
jgi:hypothetical protein